MAEINSAYCARRDVTFLAPRHVRDLPTPPFHYMRSQFHLGDFWLMHTSQFQEIKHNNACQVILFLYLAYFSFSLNQVSTLATRLTGLYLSFAHKYQDAPHLTQRKYILRI